MTKNLFRNKVVVITDGESQLGQTLALELALEKAQVVVIGSNKNILNKPNEELEKIKKKTGEVIPIVGNFSSKKDCDDVVAQVNRAVGNADILINNFSVFKSGKLEEYKFSDIETLVNLNITGNIYFLKSMISVIKNNKKAGLILISDYFGKTAYPFLSLYCATQFAINGFYEAIGRELASDRIQMLNVKIAGIRGTFDEENEKKLEKLGFTFDDSKIITGKIFDSYNNFKSELNFGKKEKSLAFWNNFSKKSVDSKIKKIKSKLLNTLSSM